ESEARRDAGLLDRLEALEAGEDPERAVQMPALGHRVDVRPGHNDRTAVTESAESVAGRIDAGRQSRLFHATEEPGPGFLMRRAPAGARDAAAVRIPAES